MPRSRSRSRSRSRKTKRSKKCRCEECEPEATIFVLYNWNKFGFKLDAATSRAIRNHGWWWVGCGGHDDGIYANETQYSGPRSNKRKVGALLRKGFRKLVDKDHIENFKVCLRNPYS